MQTIEIEALINKHHEIHITLPQDAPEGRARIIIHYETVPPLSTQGNMDDFLDTLPLNRFGRSHADILHQVQEERGSWDDAILR